MCGDSEIRWEQIGQDLVGEALGDAFGFYTSLSADGSTVAIGAPGNDDGDYYAGHVRVYRQNVTSEEWEQIGQDIDGEYYYDLSGGRVSISADGGILAIAAPLHDSTNATNFTYYDAGHVRVYKYDASYADGTWVQIGQDIDGTCLYGLSGVGLSLSAEGTTVAIGSFGCLYEKGLTRIYEYDITSGQWEQKGQDIEGEDYSDESGASVSLSANGSRVAIGAPDNNGDNGNDSGHVRIYEYDNSSGLWEKIGQDIDGEGGGDGSGRSVSLSADGSRVAIGALENSNDNGFYSGHVRIYDIDNSSGLWEQIGQDIDGEGEGDSSGWSVSISADGSTVAIGAPRNTNANGDYSGHARIYGYDNSSGQWEQIGQDLDGEGYYDTLGFSVSISADGKTVAVGAQERYYGGDAGNRNGNGYVRIFHQAV